MLKDLKFCDVKDNYVLMHMDIFLLYIRNGGFMVMVMVNKFCKQGLPDDLTLIRDQLIFSKGIYIYNVDP